MSILFIADLHLDEKRPNITRAFFDFLEHHADTCDALYILGDFFEVWVGDDDDAPFAKTVIQKLRTFAEKGPDVFFMHGNRDFLIGQGFASDASLTLLNDPTVITLDNTPLLLMHGDSLCTKDLEYMAFRQQARSQQWQQQILSQPLDARRQLAQQIRAQSKSMNSLKAEDIMDVTLEEVDKALIDHKVTRLIHGHTHRPARHSLTIEGQTAERMVLGDWGEYGWYIQYHNREFELIKFPINND